MSGRRGRLDHAAAAALACATQLRPAPEAVVASGPGLGAVAQAAGVVARVAWGALADRSGRPLVVLVLVLAAGVG